MNQPSQISENVGPQPNTAAQEPQIRKAAKPRHRRGKVARLPEAIRDQVNQMLDDGLCRCVLAALILLASSPTAGKWIRLRGFVAGPILSMRPVLRSIELRSRTR